MNSVPLNNALTAVVSRLTCPFTNLAIEDWLFRKAGKDSVVLFIYRNDASVIIGRNQNPFVEVDLSYIHQKNIALVRRFSGGGAVYHDEGNVNFSFITSNAAFSRAKYAQVVLRTLQRSGVRHVSLNERNDILLRGKKISGSAYKLTSSRAYHHGTMLLSPNIPALTGALRLGMKNRQPSRFRMVSKGVTSVKSPVNAVYGEERGTVTESTGELVQNIPFVRQLKREFVREHPEVSGAYKECDITSMPDALSVPHVSQQVSLLQGDDWIWGQTPDYSSEIDLPFGSLVYKCHRGRLVSWCLTDASETDRIPGPLRTVAMAFMKRSEQALFMPRTVVRVAREVLEEEGAAMAEVCEVKDILLQCM